MYMPKCQGKLYIALVEKWRRKKQQNPPFLHYVVQCGSVVFSSFFCLFVLLNRLHSIVLFVSLSVLVWVPPCRPASRGHVHGGGPSCEGGYPQTTA